MKASGTYATPSSSATWPNAAAAIGADAHSVGAYYHDIGKTVRPYFATENITDSGSPHDKLDPLTSARIIISHVTDGLDLALKYRLPARIQDLISAPSIMVALWSSISISRPSSRPAPVR